MWRRRAIEEGFTLNQFREHFGIYVEASNVCSRTKALGAEIAYMSLVRRRREEVRDVEREMEVVQWMC